MNKVTDLSPVWRDWIAQNLARNDAAQSLIDQRVRENFDPAYASAAVYGLVPTGSVFAAPVPLTRGRRRAAAGGKIGI